MKSTIRIEYDFDTKQPVLRIVHDKQSDDLRDTMLKAFIEEASFQNSTMFITYPEYTGRMNNHIIEIRCERNMQEEVPAQKARMVHDNSDGFRKYLTDHFIDFAPNEHFTAILDNKIDLYLLGRNVEKYKQENP